VFLERSISNEVMTGPPRLRTDRAPIGQWDPRAMENVPETHRPYAVVIRLPLRSESEILEFEVRLTDFLRDQQGLGYVDGTGTDGEIWEIFLDGDDADALWDAVPPPGVTATLAACGGHQTTQIRLSSLPGRAFIVLTTSDSGKAERR
jgi:hypothetical protein